MKPHLRDIINVKIKLVSTVYEMEVEFRETKNSKMFMYLNNFPKLMNGKLCNYLSTNLQFE